MIADEKTEDISRAESEINELAELLRPTVLRISRLLRREVQVGNTSLPQLMLLKQIWKKPGIGVSELAEMEGMTKPTISSQIDRLVTAGLVARTTGDILDRRRVGLSATAAGNQLILEVREQRNAFLAVRLNRLSPASRELIRAAIGPLRTIGGFED